MRTRPLLVVLALAVPVAARAQPAPEPVGASDAKSPRRAVLLSSGGAAAMLVPVLNLAAIPVGPSLGHFYAGNRRQAWTGVAIRSGALAVGVGALLGDAFSCLGGCGPDEGSTTGEKVAIGAAVVIVGSALYDVATAGESARDYNRRRGVAVGAAPVVGGHGAGARVAVRF